MPASAVPMLMDRTGIAMVATKARQPSRTARGRRSTPRANRATSPLRGAVWSFRTHGRRNLSMPCPTLARTAGSRVTAVTTALFFFSGRSVHVQAPGQQPPQGQLRCEGDGRVIIKVDGKDYAVNAKAGPRYPLIQTIWNENTAPSVKIDRLILIGLTLCNWHTSSTKSVRKRGAAKKPGFDLLVSSAARKHK